MTLDDLLFASLPEDAHGASIRGVARASPPGKPPGKELTAWLGSSLGWGVKEVPKVNRGEKMNSAVITKRGGKKKM